MGITTPVTSPTYTIVNEYDGLLPFYHIDAYRMGSVDDFEFIDARRYLYGNGLCAVEWSELVTPAIPPDAIIVAITPNADGSRTIVIDCPAGMEP